MKRNGVYQCLGSKTAETQLLGPKARCPLGKWVGSGGRVLQKWKPKGDLPALRLGGLPEGESPPPPTPTPRPAPSRSDSAVTQAVGAPEELVRRFVLALKVYCPAVIWSLGRVTKSSAKETALGWLWGRGQRGERGRKALG